MRRYRRFWRHLYLSLHEKDDVLFYLVIILACIVISFFTVKMMSGFESQTLEKESGYIAVPSDQLTENLKKVYHQMDDDAKQRVKKALGSHIDSLNERDTKKVEKILQNNSIDILKNGF